MDSNPSRREDNIARWTFAGSMGVLFGPLLISGATFIVFGWRGVFFVLTGFWVLVLAGAWRFLPRQSPDHPRLPNLLLVWDGFREALLLFK